MAVKILPGIDPKQFFKDEKHIIVYAFSIGERHYFRFDDMLNIPYDRALKCLVYWRELEMNCSPEFLKLHCQAFDNVFSRNLQQQSISLTDLTDLKMLNDHLKMRLELPKEPELMYKFASVVFFDQHENPRVYEFGYGVKKIKFWKKETSLTDFFLQKPLVELIPYLRHAAENLEQFSQMTEKISSQHLEKVSAMLST